MGHSQPLLIDSITGAPAEVKPVNIHFYADDTQLDLATKPEQPRADPEETAAFVTLSAGVLRTSIKNSCLSLEVSLQSHRSLLTLTQ